MLELFVLRDEKTRRREKQIKRHLAACRGCSNLYQEIRSFYEEVEREGQSTVPSLSRMAERALVRKRNELEPYFAESAADVVEYREVNASSIWKRIDRFRHENPVKSTLGAILLAALLVFTLDRLPVRTQQPSYYKYDASADKFEVYGSENRLLWSAPSFGLDGVQELEGIANVKRTILADLDKNGVDEVLTTVPVGHEQWPFVLNIFDSRGKISKEFRFHVGSVAYGNVKYYGSFGAYYLLKDRTANDRINLFVTANNHRSPAFIARLDDHLKILGEYWHYGEFNAFLTENNEGTARDLILAGSDDSEDMSGRAYNFMAVLDPNKISGNTQSSATPGFGLKNSRAELYYVRFPRTSIERVMGKRPWATMEAEPQDSVFYIGVRSDWVMTDAGSFGFDYVFRKRDMSVREVKFIMPTGQTFAMLKREGKLHGTFNEQYLNRLKKRVRYWDGKKWVKKATRIEHYPDGGNQKSPTVP